MDNILHAEQNKHKGKHKTYLLHKQAEIMGTYLGTSTYLAMDTGVLLQNDKKKDQESKYHEKKYNN